jgi:hypothetical protein
MNMQNTTWRSARAETAGKLGFGLAVCSAVGGLLYATHMSSKDLTLASVEPRDRPAIASAKVQDNPAMVKLQAIVDASPIVQSTAHDLAAVPKPIPAPRKIVSAKSVNLPKRIASRSGNPVSETAMAFPSGVERFDRCSPQCETQDPLITGYSGPNLYPATAVLPTSDQQEAEFSISPLKDAREILDKAVDAPGTAFRRGREALAKVVRTDW